MKRLIILPVLLAHASLASAELYRCETGRGTYTYTNIPCMDIERPEPTRKVQRMLVDPDELQHAGAGKSTPIPPAPLARQQAQQPKITPLQHHAARIEIATVDLPADMQTREGDIPFSARRYRVGMSWLMRLRGQFPGFERYEITEVGAHRVHGKRVLLGNDKQPLAGGIEEEFVVDLHDRPELHGPIVTIRAAGYAFECRQQRGDQGVVWRVDALPLITPWIRYRSGDESVLVEFTP